MAKKNTCYKTFCYWRCCYDGSSNLLCRQSKPPNIRLLYFTQAFLIPVFMNRPANVDVIGINTKAAEKTLGGLLRFASALVKYEYDVVLDLHNVIRTMIIRGMFRIKGKKGLCC